MLFVLGLGFTGLGLLGAALPLVPTTPFLLLAGACFARSSPRWHQKLLETRAFGPYLRQWQANRTVPRAAKRRAYVLVVVTFAFSIGAVEPLLVRVVLGLLGLALLAFLAWLPETERHAA